MKMKKILALALSALLLVAVGVGGTLAWLTAESSTITNTFEPTTLSVSVAETKENFTMIPGATIEKDPKVSYTSDVDAWLFVEITESANLDAFITYGIADGWTIVPGTTNVYYRQVAATPNEGPFSVIEDAAGTVDQVTVNNTVTKEMMDALKNATAQKPPCLSRLTSSRRKALTLLRWLGLN